jgi:hypothetical protein
MRGKIKILLRRFFLLIFTFCIFHSAFSQVFPVQLSTQLIPPYSSYLSDYGDPTNEKLKCILVLQDFSVTHRDVKLEITITGNGYIIKTKSSFVPSPITLLPGTPQLITSIDLAPYLQTQNLDFTGINAADYELKKILPEGYYSICIRAVDYYNVNYTQLSNESCNNAWFFLNDPPFLNYPSCEMEIDPVTPQLIIFQWTAMNLNSPNSVLGTEYDFELFELRPNGGIPNNIVQNSAPIFSITTTQPFLQYSITEPTLYLGLNYVWRVRARDLSGRDLFKNEGWSQICTFTYGNINSAFSSDAFTLNLQAQASTHRQGKVWWNMIANFSQYHIQLRKSGTQNWFDYYSTTAELKINELEPSTAYEARVMGTGNNLESAWSNTASFTTQPLPNFNCNDQTQPINALSANPLLAATPFMIFQIGQFEMTATSIRPDGAPGYFSGMGRVKMYGLKIGVEYNHVYINDNLQITSGNVVALTEGIDAWVDNWMIDQAQEDAIFIEENINEVYVQDSTIYVITEDGDTLTFEFPPMDHPVVINDSDGSSYLVNPDGTVTILPSWIQHSSDTLDATEENQIVFSKAEDQIYGTDNYEILEWAEHYETILLPDSSNYFVTNKSLKSGGNDYVMAQWKNESITISDIIFQTSSGQTLSSEIIGNKAKIRIENLSDDQSIYAKSGSLKLGKLNVKVFEEEEKEVVIIPIGNANLPDENLLRSEIQKTFSQGVIKINLSVKPNYTSNSWDLNGDGKLAAGNFSLLQDYSAEMKKLSSDWLDANEIDKDAYVLFVISGFDEQNVDKGGYMPLGRHKGFIKSGSALKVYSHELAHGIFGLEHTFPEVSEGNTNNLLDYTDGIDLNDDQWEKMRFNLSRFDLVNDEEENFYNMSFVDQNLELNEATSNTSEISCNRFLSKFGKIISFDYEQRSKIESYLLVDGKLHGVKINVGGVPKKFVQASAANYTNQNEEKQITSLQDNEALICFECLDEICSQVSNFSGPEVCEVVQGVGLNGQPQKIYNRVPAAFLIDLRNFTSDCFPGLQVMNGIVDGEPQCHLITESDCDNNANGTGGALTGNELVEIELVDDQFYGCEKQFSWVNLFGKAVKVDEFTSVAATGMIIGFKKDGREYVACNHGGVNNLDETNFHQYVDKELFLQKESELNQAQLKIRVKDLSDTILYKQENFQSSNSNDEVHYKVWDRFGCYFEYYFAHDGRNEYEFDGNHFENVNRSVYWRTSCAMNVLHDAFCGTAIAGAEQFAEFLGPNINLAKIPANVYDPTSSDYSVIFYSTFVAFNPTIWLASEEAAMHQFAFLCGLFNGLVNEAEGLVESLPILLQYVCDANFRQEINAAIGEINLEEIQNSIEEDFQGNSYLQSEAAGRYTIAVVSLVIPLTKVNWGAKATSIISKVKSLPKKLMTFIRTVKNGGINGLRIVNGNIQKIIFVNAFNVEIELARFTEDGVMVIDESRIISQLPDNPTMLFDIGEASYKTSDNLPAKTGELKVVKDGDGEVWVVVPANVFSTDQLNHYVSLATKQNDFPKVMLGKHDNGGVTGYITRAGNDHTYFDMGSENWNEAKSIVGSNSDEMWRINQKFIDEQKLLNKDFYFSHDPNLATGYFLREVNYLTDDLGGTIVTVNSNTWKIVW